MAFRIIRNDITKVHADAIVNTANPEVTIGAGLDTAIYEAAGKRELLAARAKIGLLPEGTIGVTPAFRLPAKYIIHASGPWWEGGDIGEADVLKACYDKSLKEALRLGCETIAFPLFPSGICDFPREEALRIAVDSFSGFLENCEMEIFLVVFDDKSASISEKMFRGIHEYVDENYVANIREDECARALPKALKQRLFKKEEALRAKEQQVPPPLAQYSVNPLASVGAPLQQEAPLHSSAFTGREPRYDLDFYINTAEDPFCQYLQQLINKKGYKNAQVYKRANLTKQYFSKLMNGQVNPAKEKLLSIAIALELNMDETKDMLMRAGYAMSPCSKTDLVVAYFIRSRKYNMFDIEIALDDFGLPTLTSDP